MQVLAKQLNRKWPQSFLIIAIGPTAVKEPRSKFNKGLEPLKN